MYPSVTQILQSVGLAGDYSKVPPVYLARAAARGHGLHKALEWEATGALDESSLHPDLVPMVGAYRQFAKDHAHVVESSEVELLDEGLGVIGHIDRVGSVDGIKTCLLDWKSSKQPDPQTWRWQLGGYRLLWDRAHPERPAEKCYAVHLNQKATLYDLTDDGEAMRVFEAAVVVYRARMRR